MSSLFLGHTMTSVRQTSTARASPLESHQQNSSPHRPENPTGDGSDSMAAAARAASAPVPTVAAGVFAPVHWPAAVALGADGEEPGSDMKSDWGLGSKCSLDLRLKVI